MRIVLCTVIFVMILPNIASADMFGDLVNSVKKTVEETTSSVTNAISSSASSESVEEAEASETSGPNGAVSGSEAQFSKIRNADIDGAKLGMAFDKAIKNMKANGYRLSSPEECLQKPNDTSNPCYEQGPGVHVELYKGDGRATNIKVFLWQIDGTVYRITRNALYQGSTDKTVDSVIDEFDAKYGGGYKVDRGSSQRGATFEYDDETPPPFSRDIKTPHAKVSVKGGRGFRIIEVLIWQDAVGASGLFWTE